MYGSEFGTRTISRNGQIFAIIFISVALIICLGLALFFGGVYIVAAVVIGIPLALVLASLLFGNVSKGRGIFPWPLLYILGLAIAAFIWFSDDRGLRAAYWVPAALFFLAEKRRRANHNE